MQWVILCVAVPTILVPVWVIVRRGVAQPQSAPISMSYLTPAMQARLRRQATAYLRRNRKRPIQVDWKKEGF